MRLGDWLSPSLLALAAVLVVAVQCGGRSR
jgi:hypothetical protein